MSAKFCLDANVLITGWNVTYPPRIFMPLWSQIATHAASIVIIKPVYDEIDPIAVQHKKLSQEEQRELYPLRVWLEETSFQVATPDDESSLLSLRMEREYEVINASKGADQNDITIIAYARTHELTVVTLESEQKQLPRKKSNYKIPLICSEKKIPCITFISLLDRLGITI